MQEGKIYAVVLFHNRDEVGISPFRSRDDAVAAMVETARAEIGSLDGDGYAEFSVGENDFDDADEALEALAKDPYIFTINGDNDDVEITLKELTLK